MKGNEYANQFGINLGAINQTKSVLKTAKLKQKKMERENDVDNKGDEYFGNYLAKNSPDAIVKPVDENADGTIDESEKKNAVIATGRKFGAYNKTEKVEERKSEVASRNNRRSTLNSIARSRENRLAAKANADVKKTEDAMEDFLTKEAKRLAMSGYDKTEIDAMIAEKRLGKKFNVANINYDKAVEVETTQEVIEESGRALMSATTPEDYNKLRADKTDEYMKIVEEKGADSPEAHWIKVGLDSMPGNFATGTPDSQQKYDNAKGVKLGEMKLASEMVDKKHKARLANQKVYKKEAGNKPMSKKDEAVDKAKKEKQAYEYLKDDYGITETKKRKIVADAMVYNQNHGGSIAGAVDMVMNKAEPSKQEKKEKGKKKFVEGKIYEQNGVKYKYENGKFKPQK